MLRNYIILKFVPISEEKELNFGTWSLDVPRGTFLLF